MLLNYVLTIKDKLKDRCSRNTLKGRTECHNSTYQLGQKNEERFRFFHSKIYHSDILKKGDTVR